MASYAQSSHPPATASHKLPLGEQGMELYLVDYWLDGCDLQHPVYLTQAKVCHPQMPDLTLPHQLIHGLPASASPIHDTKPNGHIEVAILKCCCRLDNCRSDPCHSLFQVHSPQQALGCGSLKSRLSSTWKVEQRTRLSLCCCPRPCPGYQDARLPASASAKGPGARIGGLGWIFPWTPYTCQINLLDHIVAAVQWLRDQCIELNARHGDHCRNEVGAAFISMELHSLLRLANWAEFCLQDN